MSLARRAVIVTGGSRGLGLAVAQRFAQDDMHVAICARDAYVLDLFATETVLAAGGRKEQYVLPIAGDVSDSVFVNRMIALVESEFGRIDVLVCNAGVYRGTWQEMIQTNLIGTILCVQTMLPIMQRQGYGKIITISGGGVGGKPVPGLSAYSASKAAVVQYTESLASELPAGITVNAIAPGPLDSDVQREKAVDLIEWLASSASDGISGRLLSAVWDNWRNLPPLSDDDYRLRRIVDNEHDGLPEHLKSWHATP